MNIQNVKLSALVPGNGTNPRKAVDKAEDARLLASIKAIGLLTPLMVRRLDERRFEVVAGNRRLAALRKMAGKKDREVSVVILTGGNNAEIALAENVIRANLHPVEEYDAYSALLEGGGMTTEDVAKRFGVKEKWIRQRLQLASLAPELRQSWLKGEMTAEQAEALSGAADHNRQLEIWRTAKKSGEYAMRADCLRRDVKGASLKPTDPRVVFIGGVEAYVAAGGTFYDDLFADAQVLKDGDLVDRMVAERFVREAAPFVADGWSFVDSERNSYSWRKPFDVKPWLTDEERERLNGLKSYSEEARALEDLGHERAAADPAARAKAGVRLGYDSKGVLTAQTLVNVEGEAEAVDEEARDAIENVRGFSDGADRERPDPPEEDAPKVNHALRESLSETMTVALSKAIKDAPQVVIPALYATLRVKLAHGLTPSLFKLAPHEAWRGVWPDETDTRLTWAGEFESGSENETAHVLEAMASLLACVVDARIVRGDLRGDLRGDMTERMRPMVEAMIKRLPTFADRLAEVFDGEAYFKRITAEACQEAIEAMGRPRLKNGNKAQVVSTAALYAKETGWLPVELRTCAYRGPQ
jgi:ParB/RepB/Spo0J family partition protein